MMNSNYELFKAFIKGKKVGVLGLGVSNIPAIEFLHSLGAVIYGCDFKSEKDFSAPILETLNKTCAGLYLGSQYLSHLEEFDVILKSPGIKVLQDEIQNAIKKGVKVTSEMEIFMSICPCKVIGVTGSDGKTTTTTLIYEMLKNEGYRVHVGGNIGTPLLAKIDDIYKDDIVVLELSSFQLQTMRFSPQISVITNISPNHLDYHKDMQEYIEAKANVFKYHKENSKLILNYDNEITRSLKDDYKYDVLMFSRKQKTDGVYLKNEVIYYKDEEILDTLNIKIKGVHNIENYMAAIGALIGLVSKETINNVARNFGGVEHRMEFVRKLSDVSFYNDSIGSSPTRTIAGLDSFTQGRIVLIAGGYDKNLAYDKLAQKIHQRVSALVLIGETKDKIKNEVEKLSTSQKSTPIVLASSMKEAVDLSFALAKGLTGENHEVNVILSPACASFDMYKNFEFRGWDFKKIVNSL